MFPEMNEESQKSVLRMSPQGIYEDQMDRQGIENWTESLFDDIDDHPEFSGRQIRNILAGALAAKFNRAGLSTPKLTQGCKVEGKDTSGFAEAVATAEAANVAIVIAGDQVRLFGHSTVGKGNDIKSLELPGI